MLPDSSAQSDVAVSPAHLLHVFPSFDIGGSQRRLATLLSLLGSHLRHTIVSLDGHWQALSLLPAHADVATLCVPPAQSSLPARLIRIRKAIAFIKPDALLTYNWGAMDWALANGGRLPHLHHEDGFGSEESHRQLQRRVWMRRLALRNSALMVPSQALAEIATARWGIPSQQLYHIPNGICASDRVANPPKELASELFSHRCRIVWVGGLRKEKNPLRLLRAFAPIAGEASLLLVGDGPERRPLLEEIEHRGLRTHVRLLGKRDDARDIIMQSDILALSSDTEQMPFAVLEAMDAGLPVVATDVGDIRAMVAPQNQPFIVPLQGDGFGRALKALVDDAAMRATVGSANRKRVRDFYSAHQMAARYRALVDQVLQGRVHV